MQNERRLVPLSGIRPQPVRWLWPNRVPLGAITVLDGDPGQGKSTLVYDLAARLTAGKPMPNCEGRGAPAGVVLLQEEDNLASTVQPRLRAAGADLERLRVYDRPRFTSQPLVLPEDLPLLEAAAADVRARLVVLDPLSAFLGRPATSDAGVRKVLGPLTAFAEKANLAILLVRHLTKGGPANALYRGAGSVAVIGAARSALLVGPDAGGGDPHRHVLVQTKTNLSAAVSLSYRTVKEGDDIVIEWLGVSPRTAAELVQAAGWDRSALHEAMYVLYSILADGPVPARDAIGLAEKAGVSKHTLDRAKKALGVVSRKRGSGVGSSWSWALPDDEAVVRPFKERDLDELMDRLLHDDDPPLPGDEWKGGPPEDDGDGDGGSPLSPPW
jgi:hypothetical protein